MPACVRSGLDVHVGHGIAVARGGDSTDAGAMTSGSSNVNAG